MAGFFSTLFGGGAEREAADRNRQLYGQYKTEGQQNLASGLTNSLASLNSGSRDAINTLGINRDVYSQYGNTANQAIDSGMAGSLGALGAARGAYDPVAALGTKYGTGTSLYMDSLGAGGAEGNQRAVEAFQAGPGYNWALDQGNTAINRRRAAAGMLNSGNADIDAMKFGQGLANQEYGNWQARLAGLINPELAATSGAAAGRAGSDMALANLYNTNAGQRVGVAGNVAQGTAGANTGIAGLQSGLGAGQAGLYSQNADNLTNLAGSVTSGNAAANNQQAAGESAGARNLLNLGQSVLTSFAGGGFGGLGPTSTGNANGPQPLTGGNIFGRMFS